MGGHSSRSGRECPLGGQGGNEVSWKWMGLTACFPRTRAVRTGPAAGLSPWPFLALTQPSALALTSAPLIGLMIHSQPLPSFLCEWGGGGGGGGVEPWASEGSRNGDEVG